MIREANCGGIRMTECERIISEEKIPPNFLNPEVRDEYEITTEIKKVWAIELDLYQKFSEICNKHNLRYWVAFGTLLGAIRHNGFIPWDDDLDVWMPRNDYEKLLEIGADEFHLPYFLQTTLNDNDYYSAFARLRNSNTTGSLNVSRNNKCNNGIFIDIFPLDGAPENKCSWRRRLFTNHFRNVLAHAYLYNINPNIMTRLANKILHIPFLHYDHRKTYLKVNQYAQLETWKQSEYVGMMAFPWKFSANLVFRKEYFEKTIMHTFEFLEVPVPEGYDQLLRQRYGDYMKFPPVEQRGTWHDFIFDPDKPYNEA